jgi:DNA-binding NarL/FixJ family response regulator
VESSRGTTPQCATASSNKEEYLVSSYKLGVNAYGVKPVDFHEFVNAIKELGVWAIINATSPTSAWE